MKRAILVFGGLAMVLGAVNYAVFDKERLLARGTTVFLELAPVDPRSLIQGDYMRLDYALARDARVRSGPGWPRNGHIVVRVDERGIAHLVRRSEGGALGAGEHLLRYRLRGGRIRIGSDAFFFEEGSANRYGGARYGELKVDADGESVLVGLRDQALRRL